MLNFKTLISCALSIFALSLNPAYADTFIEQNGIVLMEAESSPAVGGWDTQTSFSGYSGSGYHIWTGSDSFNVSTAGRGTMTYRFRIQRAGNYQMIWRSRIGRGDLSSEHNDSWVRFPSGRNISGQHGLNGWTKVFMNQKNRWFWGSFTVDFVGKPIRQYFSAGEHTMQVSGRSNGHAIDRIALYRYEDVDFSESRFDSLSNSPTSGGGAPAPAPAPEPVPAPAPAPTPAPAPAPAPEPAPVPSPTPVEPVVPPVANVSAPVVRVDGSSLRWDDVDAVSINIHRGNGEWIETISADANSWESSSSGEYYVVATGTGSWETWGRSATVQIEAGGTSGSAGSTFDGLSAQVYSDTALELFWAPGSSQGNSYEVRRDGVLLTVLDGASYFDSGLQPGTNYGYSVTEISSTGDVQSQATVGATTRGNAGGSISADAGTGSISLSGGVYSQSAIELFWDTSALGDDYFLFDIYQDGILIGQTDGRSFFVDGLSSGTGYNYRVSVKDASGRDLTSDNVNLATYAADTP